MERDPQKELLAGWIPTPDNEEITAVDFKRCDMGRSEIMPFSVDLPQTRKC